MEELVKKLEFIFRKKLEDADPITWVSISLGEKLNAAFIEHYSDDIDWTFLSQNKQLTMDIIRKYESKFDWYEISVHQPLTDELVGEFSELLDWRTISYVRELTYDFIMTHLERLSIPHLMSNDVLHKSLTKEQRNELRDMHSIRKQFLDVKRSGR